MPLRLYAGMMRDVQPLEVGSLYGVVEVSTDWQAWFAQQGRRVDLELSTHLNVLKAEIETHGPLLEAVEYSLCGSGKRLRPVLVLECGRICGGGASAAWPAALAIECIHTFSLIHDDLPAMDDDDLRRGKLTCHKFYGEAVAVLAGDFLVAHAFELLAAAPVAADLKRVLVETLAQGTRDMIVGQGADIEGERRVTDAKLVRFIHRNKTARLLETACVLGGLSAGATETRMAALGEYGRRFGLAFQISDDLLDRTGKSEKLGKRVGKDAVDSKQTYPAAYGLEDSRQHAQAEIDAAIAALDSFGSDGDRLRDLARYVLERER